MGKKFKKIMACLMTAIIGVGVLTTTATAVSLPDQSRTGSITIHKYRTPDDYTPGTGTGEESTVDGEGTTALPVGEVTFAIFKVGDLDTVGTAASTYDESKYDASNVYTPTYDGIEGVVNTTDIHGVCKFSDLELGRYLVVEVSAPAYVAEKSNPFFVDVPMVKRTGEGAGTDWLYDIHVYPKNHVKYDSPEMITKEVDTHSVFLDNEVEWTVRVSIPKSIGAYTSFIIYDTIADQLEYVDDSLTVDNESIADSTYFDATFSNKELTISMTHEGMSGYDYLYRSEFGGDSSMQTVVEFKYRTVVKESLFDEQGFVKPIENKAILTYNYPNIPSGDTGKTTDIVEVHTGGVKFIKVTPDDVPLSGAQFKIADSYENAVAGIFIQDSEGNDMVSTSDENGVVSFVGLKYGEDGAYNDTSSDYYVVETKAPTGYVLHKEPISVTVDYRSYSDAFAANTHVTNIPEMDMPGTGSVTAIWFIAVGAVLIGLAGIMFFTKKSRDIRL